MKVKIESEVAQSCSTLLDPMDCSPSGSSVHGILQARTLERIVIPFFRGAFQSRDQTQVSCIAGKENINKYMLFYCYQKIILDPGGSISEKAIERKDHLI